MNVNEKVGTTFFGGWGGGDVALSYYQSIEFPPSQFVVKSRSLLPSFCSSVNHFQRRDCNYPNNSLSSL